MPDQYGWDIPFGNKPVKSKNEWNEPILSHHLNGQPVKSNTILPTKTYTSALSERLANLKLLLDEEQAKPQGSPDRSELYIQDLKDSIKQIG